MALDLSRFAPRLLKQLGEHRAWTKLLQSMEAMLKLVDAVELNNFVTTLLVEAVKMREETVLVRQAMQAIRMFCELDAAFCRSQVCRQKRAQSGDVRLGALCDVAAGAVCAC